MRQIIKTKNGVKKSELINVVNDLKMTARERISMIEKIEAHQSEALNKKELEALGFYICPPSKFDSNDIGFFVREAACYLWMTVAGIAIIWSGFWLADEGMRTLAAFFGVAGIMVAALRSKSLISVLPGMSARKRSGDTLNPKASGK